MPKNQKITFSMYYNQKNTCVKVEKHNLICTAVQKTVPWQFHHRDLFLV